MNLWNNSLNTTRELQLIPFADVQESPPVTAPSPVPSHCFSTMDTAGVVKGCRFVCNREKATAIKDKC